MDPTEGQEVRKSKTKLVNKLVNPTARAARSRRVTSVVILPHGPWRLNMVKKEKMLMNIGMGLAIVGALLFLAAGLLDRADLGLMGAAAAWGSASATVVYGAAESAIKQLQAQVRELEGPRT